MTDKTKEVLRLALRALEYIDLTDNDRDFLQPHECYMLDEAITALRSALALVNKVDQEESSGTEQPAIKQDLTPEQPAPVAEPRKPQQEPVRHWSDCATNNRGCPELLGTCDCGGIPPKPEPIAWLLEFVDEDGLSRRDVFYEQKHLQRHVKHNTALRGLTCKVEPLYTSPPAQRTWVGLTDKEKREARNAVSYSPLAMTMGEWTEAVQDATEAKLKEKNSD